MVSLILLCAMHLFRCKKLVTVVLFVTDIFLQEQVWVQVQKHHKRAATNMLESAREKQTVANMHDSTLVPISLVDQSKTDHGSLSGIIADVDYEGLFQIHTKQRFQSFKFCQNQSELCHQQMLTPELQLKTQDTVVSMGQVAIIASKGHGKGYQKINCNGNCQFKRCKC